MAKNIHLRSGYGQRGRRIGLLGGSFNPAHEGHRAMSLHALRALKLDEVWWLVSPQNPLKKTDNMLPLAVRMDFAGRVARHPRILVTDIETQAGTRYTIDTLQMLRRRFPGVRFVWLMGADNLRQMTRWKSWQGIFATVPVAVFRRPAYAVGRSRGKVAQRLSRSWHPPTTKNIVDQELPAWTILYNRLNTLSATKIREDKTTWQRLLQKTPARKRLR